jgi:hypothetical protein
MTLEVISKIVDPPSGLPVEPVEPVEIGKISDSNFLRANGPTGSTDLR